MDFNENRSQCKVSVQFGELMGTEKEKTRGQIDIFLSKESYEIQKITLQQLVQSVSEFGDETNSLDIDYAIILALKVEPDKKQLFLQTLDSIISGEDHSQIAIVLKNMINSGELAVKYCQGFDGKIYISLKIGPLFEEQAIEQLKMFLMMGLDNISLNQMNTATITFSSQKSFLDYYQSVKQGNKETLYSYITHSSKFDLNIDISNNFTLMFLEFIRNIGLFPLPELSNTSKLLLQKLNKCYLNFAFSPASSILEDFNQNNFFNWIYKFSQIAINRTNEKIYVYMMECILPEVEVYFTVPDLGSVKASINSEGFLEFFKYFAHPE